METKTQQDSTRIINPSQIYNLKNYEKNSFHRIKIELKNTTGDEVLFVSAGSTRVNLLFRRILDNHF